MVNLSVNLNKIALLRNQRDVGYPSVLRAAGTVLEAGAQGITVHPRPDERHIRRADVPELAAFVADHPDDGIEFNVEGYPSPEFVRLLAETRPHQATLVPDEPYAVTSDHGWDVPANRTFLRDVIARLRDFGCRVSVFLDADDDSIRAAKDIGADRIELYTGPYAAAFDAGDPAEHLKTFARAAAVAAEVGLGLNAGHDLTLANLPALRGVMPNLEEVSIGHALTAEAVWTGLDVAVKAYLEILRASAGSS